MYHLYTLQKCRQYLFSYSLTIPDDTDIFRVWGFLVLLSAKMVHLLFWFACFLTTGEVENFSICFEQLVLWFVYSPPLLIFSTGLPDLDHLGGGGMFIVVVMLTLFLTCVQVFSPVFTFWFFKNIFYLIEMFKFYVVTFVGLSLHGFWASWNWQVCRHLSPLRTDWKSWPRPSLEGAWWLYDFCINFFYLCCYLPISFWGTYYFLGLLLHSGKGFLAWESFVTYETVFVCLCSDSLCANFLFLSPGSKNQSPWGSSILCFEFWAIFSL